VWIGTKFRLWIQISTRVFFQLLVLLLVLELMAVIGVYKESIRQVQSVQIDSLEYIFPLAQLRESSAAPGEAPIDSVEHHGVPSHTFVALLRPVGQFRFFHTISFAGTDQAALSIEIGFE
jgi:hypothetical protein